MTMVTKRLYLEDTYLYENEAKIKKLTQSDRGDFFVELDQTIFHPQGGGQPSDKGMMAGKEVIKVLNSDDQKEVLHQVENFDGLEVGKIVKLSVDKGHRLECAALHTSGHILAATIARKFPGIVQIGAHHFIGESRVKFRVPADKNIKLKDEDLEKEFNSEVSKRFPIEVVTTDTGRSLRLHAFPEIEHYNPGRCAGTHLSHSNEIRDFKIRKISVKKNELSIGYSSNHTKNPKKSNDEKVLAVAKAPSNTDDPALKLKKMRHTAAHLMAAAVQELFPETLFGVGPDISNGFYYDFVLPEGVQLDEIVLAQIQEKMEELKKKKIPMEFSEMPIDDAIKLMKKNNQKFKVELLHDLKTRGTTAINDLGDDTLAEGGDRVVKTVSFYKLGNFIDLCRGPHVKDTSKTGVFELHNITSSYWRGDAKNPTMSRVYGYCYPNKKSLDAEKKRIEDAKKYDHRNLNKTLDLFYINPDQIGPGLIMWLPHGASIRLELESFGYELEAKFGYQRIMTPVLAKSALYERSGHLPYYAEDMFAPMTVDGDEYRLKPMNCPSHHTVYNARRRNYNELPLRLAEFGHVHRYEMSGALSGMMRVRGFTQNDAHIYCNSKQAEEEFISVMDIHKEFYTTLGIDDFYMRFSLPDDQKIDKYVQDPDAWKDAIKIVENAMEKSNLPSVRAPGEAAFYGPKIDFQIKNSSGKEYSSSTNQVDFLAARKFNLQYADPDGVMKNDVYVLHRAPLGSCERMVGFLTEHYKGKFPTWLAPVQVRIVTRYDINDDPYPKQVFDYLKDRKFPTVTKKLRIDWNSGNDTIANKVRLAQGPESLHIPYTVTIGPKEIEKKNLSIRLRSGAIFQSTVDEFCERLTYEIENRLLESCDEPNLKIEPKRYSLFSDRVIAQHVSDELRVAAKPKTSV